MCSLSARGLDVAMASRAPSASPRAQGPRSGAKRSRGPCAAGGGDAGARLQQNGPSVSRGCEVELPSLSKLFRRLQMLFPTRSCDSLNVRFWLLILVSRHRNFWAPGGFLVDFGEKSAYARVQFEGSLALNRQKPIGTFPGFLGF